MAAPLQILHVDDDAEIRTIVDISLKLDRGLSVISVGSIREALAILREAPIMPSAILLDYHIGATSGVDLLRQLRQDARLDAVPALFLTARIMARDVEEMISAGAAGVLTKPFDPITLARDVRALLQRQA